MTEKSYPICLVLTAPGFTEGGLDCTWVIKAQYGQIIHMEAEEINMGDSCYSNKLKVGVLKR